MSSPTDIAIWFHYEEIAMHFNNLIMQFRLQLMGGAGAMATVGGYLIGAKVGDIVVRHRLRFILSLWLFLLISAAALLDVFYYDRLLKGAVSALLEFEKAHPEIQMSTRIEEEVGGVGRSIVYISYTLVLGPLLYFVFASWRIWKSDPEEQSASV